MASRAKVSHKKSAPAPSTPSAEGNGAIQTVQEFLRARRARAKSVPKRGQWHVANRLESMAVDRPGGGVDVES